MERNINLSCIRKELNEIKEIRENRNHAIDDLIEYTMHIIKSFVTMIDTDGIYYINEKGGINFKPWKR